MNFPRIFKTILRRLLILSLSTQLVSCAAFNKKPDPMATGALIGVNYTSEGIQRFSVDDSGGAVIGKYCISGTICCTRYPRVWNSNLKVTVSWKRSDCEKQKHLCTLETALAGTWPPDKKCEKTILMEPYTETGRVYVVFLPNDEVRVYINYPKELGIPQDPAELKGIAP